MDGANKEQGVGSQDGREEVDVEEQDAVEGAGHARQVDVEAITEYLLEEMYFEGEGECPKTPVPLASMIDLLVDIWEAEGLFDFAVDSS